MRFRIDVTIVSHSDTFARSRIRCYYLTVTRTTDTDRIHGGTLLVIEGWGSHLETKGTVTVAHGSRTASQNWVKGCHMASNAGRTAAPANLRLIKGRTAGRDSGGREVKEAPSFIRLPPEAPEWLGAVARAEWDRVVPELQRLRLLKPVDGSALAAYCEMVQLFVEATKDVHDRGITVENRSVKRNGTESVWFTANPAVGTQRNAQAAIRAWCSEFGLTPAAESKVGGQEANDGDDNPFA